MWKVVAARLDNLPLTLLRCTRVERQQVVKTISQLDQEELTWCCIEAGVVHEFTFITVRVLLLGWLREVLHVERDPLSILHPNALNGPGRNVLDDVMEKRGDDEFVVPDAQIVEQDEGNGTNVLEVPRLLVIAILPTKRVLGVVVRLLNELVAPIKRRVVEGHPSEKARTILCGGEELHLFIHHPSLGCMWSTQIMSQKKWAVYKLSFYTFLYRKHDTV